MAEKKLQDIIEGRAPSADDLTAAQEAGAAITGYAPELLAQFAAGAITLGELEGIPKADQYKMAETGYKLLTSGKLDDAKKVFLGLHALDPFDAYFLTSLGVVAVQQGQFGDAESRFDRALEINPFSTAALVGRAELRLKNGRLVDAANDLRRVIAEDPQGKDPATQRARAIAAHVKKLIEEAQAPS